MRTEPVSPLAQGLLYAGGFAWIYAVVVLVSVLTGTRFEIPNDGGGPGIPLPATWFHTALFTAIGAALWFAGRRWDRPGFVALRKHRPWLAPTVFGVVIVPASLVLIFVLVS